MVRALDLAGITVDDVEVQQPSLDDVFFALTGQPSTSSGDPGPSDALGVADAGDGYRRDAALALEEASQ